MVKHKVKKHFYVISYDISSNKRRTKLAKLLETYGYRVNYSVFECMFTTNQFNSLKSEINKLINPKKDVVLFYRLCLGCFSKRITIPKEILPNSSLVNYV